MNSSNHTDVDMEDAYKESWDGLFDFVDDDENARELENIMAMGDEALAEENFDMFEDDKDGDKLFVDIQELLQIDDREVTKSTRMPQVKRHYYEKIDPSPSKKQKKITSLNLSGGIMMIEDKGSVYLKDEVNQVLVGKSSKSFDPIPIDPAEAYVRANIYCEEVGGIGSNMGFSTFLHLSCVLVITKGRFAVIEPEQGGDIDMMGLKIEVTGLSWSTRQTRADVVINKYDFMDSICHSASLHEKYITLSFDEDQCYVDSFHGGGFDTDSSERSGYTRKIADLMRHVSSDQMSQIYESFKAFANSKYDTMNIEKVKEDDVESVLSILNRVLEEGCKDRDGFLMTASPFRVLYPQNEEEILNAEEVERRRSVQVFWEPGMQSTYHTWHCEADPYDECVKLDKKFPEWSVIKKFRSFTEGLYSKLLTHRAFASAHISSCLLPKVNGKMGCFYDIYCRVGISWNRNKASDLGWDCNFYTYSHPGEEDIVGKWSFIAPKGIYLGPTFVISRQDIHYTSILPGKFHSMISSIIPIIPIGDFHRIFMRVIAIMPSLLWSTWMTSFRTGSTRFITCCHMSQSGNVSGLIRKQLCYGGDGDSKFLRFCDFNILWRYKSFLMMRPDHKETPMFRLPLILMSIEKDFSQMLQWHMRLGNHATQCMVKVTEAARRHQLEEAEHNVFMKKQLAYLQKMIKVGLSEDEIRRCFNNSPDFPHLNIFAFMALAYRSKKDLSRPTHYDSGMGFNVWKLITDRHCIDMVSMREDVPEIKCTKVVEAMNRMLRKYEPVHGPYELIVKMHEGPKIHINYLLNHEKDAKESDREISQMTPEHRVKQNMPESFIETQLGETEADQMSDVKKYTKHVNDTIVLSKEGSSVHTSEDRTKFCQEMEPQQQAVCSVIVSKVTGNTALRSACSMGLMNVKRTIVYPPTADHDALLKGMTSKTAIVQKGPAAVKTRTIEIEKNMTQGLGAISAACVNTVYVLGMDHLTKDLFEGFGQSVIRTTSDDVKRSAVIRQGYDYDSFAHLYSHFPNAFLHMFMMKNNTDKFMTNRFFSEFNNVVATKDGMIPQSPVHATLCVQPLLSKSIFGDIVTAVNSARSTLSWGCPPDAMQSALYGMLMALRQKWLMSAEECDLLYSIGIIPKNIDELIEGFWPRSEYAMKVIVNLLTDEERDAVITGSVPLYAAVKRIELNLDGEGRMTKSKKLGKIQAIEGLDKANKVTQGIMKARLVAEALISRHIQPIHHSKRISTKNRFMNLFQTEVPDIDVTEFERFRPRRVRSFVCRARRGHLKPRMIGAKSTEATLDFRNVECFRRFSCVRRRGLSEEEARFSTMEPAIYDKEKALYQQTRVSGGVVFSSPSGLPLTKTFDSHVFRSPCAFNYTVSLTVPNKNTRTFMYKGNPVMNFEPLSWGAGTLSRVPKCAGNHIAFGIGEINKKTYVFYQKVGKRYVLDCLQLESYVQSSDVLSVEDGAGAKIHYLTGKDRSALVPPYIKYNFVPNLSGFSGSVDAIANYGNYIRSSSSLGFATYQTAFKNKRSVLPSYVREYMPGFPNFRSTGVTTFTTGPRVVLHGCRCIQKVKIDYDKDKMDVTTIDLNGSEPMVVDHPVDDIDIDFD